MEDTKTYYEKFGEGIEITKEINAIVKRLDAIKEKVLSDLPLPDKEDSKKWVEKLEAERDLLKYYFDNVRRAIIVVFAEMDDADQLALEYETAKKDNNNNLKQE